MNLPSVSRVIAGLLLLATPLAHASYPVHRPPRATPAAPESTITLRPDQLNQVIRGLGFEIQSDSIGSGNGGLPEATTSVPHDLVPEERTRFYNEMLKGFRYCRLAGGLYWRGLDADQKQLQPRWPEQLTELHDMIQSAGIEGVEFEYWSPAPFWKANRSYKAAKAGDPENKLRCFGKDFPDDGDYHGDVDRFLGDFAAACKQDLQTLRDNQIPVVMWGLQNEPFANTGYSSCTYSPDQYARTFRAVAPVIRDFDPKIQIIADTSTTWHFSYVRPVVDDPATASLVDDLVIHHIGVNANDDIPPPEPSGKPRFENEYEYLDGPASPDRCLNTVEDIMNWFQLAKAPTWFWIHALKPLGNAEASGYALGYWRPANATNPADDEKFRGLQPGHWMWNNYNWFAVGSFVRHLPWDSQAIEITEDAFDNDLRVLAFKRPDGKLTVVLSNRSFAPHTFHIDTGLTGAVFKGYRYTPEDAGTNCRGVELPALTGGTISPPLADLSWEFWEQQ
ncbi:MAG: glycoside hydrolase family 30 beta sandwich domain-containing protein [Verrucomicrobiota bacterium]